MSLYQGGQHWLYKYRRYDDVRLVFAPERDIAAFGGDPDNFQFPRWCLDMSILRAYEDGKPAKTPNHLRFDWDGAQPGDAVFVSGHPGNTDRLLTASQLDVQRDTFMPFWLMRFSELRGRMIQYSKTGEEPRRTAESYLNQIENSIKVRRKQFDALLDPALIENAREKEQALGSAAGRFRRGRERPRTPGATSSCRTRSSRAARPSTASCSSTHAYWCARRPSARSRTRRACRSSRRRGCRPSCRASAPIRRSTRISRSCGCPSASSACASGSARTTRSCARCSARIRRIRSRAALVRESTLGNASARMALYEGGQAAIDASQDPMIRLAAAVDPAARALRKTVRGRRSMARSQRGQEEIAKARFAEVRHEHLPGCDLHAAPLLRRR